MDADFWASRLHSAKRQLSAVQAARHSSAGNSLAMDDLDGDDDTGACFPCPFCYVDIEVHVLCSHLQDEHCFDLKNAVCPLCAANLGKDAIGHFIVQHASSLKRRRKSQKSGLWTGTSAMLGKDLSSFLGSSTNGRANIHETAPFLSNLSHSDSKGSQQDESSNKSISLAYSKRAYFKSKRDVIGNEITVLRCLHLEIMNWTLKRESRDQHLFNS